MTESCTDSNNLAKVGHCQIFSRILSTYTLNNLAKVGRCQTFSRNLSTYTLNIRAKLARRQIFAGIPIQTIKSPKAKSFGAFINQFCIKPYALKVMPYFSSRFLRIEDTNPSITSGLNSSSLGVNTTLKARLFLFSPSCAPS